MAVTFVNEQEQFAFRQIEKFLGKEVEKTPLPADVGEGPVYEPKDRTKRASRYCHRRGRGRGKGRGRDNKKKQDKR